METNSIDPKRIAVVAVHGIGDQTQTEPAKAMANMLLRLRDGEPTVYTPFTEEILTIGVAPTVVDEATAVSSNAALRFAHQQLTGYKPQGSDSTYRTIRLSGCRRNHAIKGAIDCAVDVYELFWADISCLKTGWFSFLNVFGELYQVLFHLPRIGLNAIISALSQQQTGPMLRGSQTLYARLHLFAAHLIAVHIPIINLILLCLATISLVYRFPSGETGFESLRIIASCLTALAVAMVMGWAMFQLVSPRFPAWAGALLTLITVIAAGASAFKSIWLLASPALADIILSTVILLISLAVVLVLMTVYKARQPGALAIACVYGALTVAYFLWDAVVTPGHRSGEAAGLATAMIAVECLSLVWVVFCSAQVLSFVFGAITGFIYPAPRTATGVTSTVPAPDARDSWRRTVWTACISMMITTQSFITVTIVLWTWLDASVHGPDWHLNANALHFFDHSIAHATPSIWEMSAMGFALLCISLGLGPVVWNEEFPPRPRSPSPSTSRASVAASVRMGETLNRAFILLGIAGLVVLATIPMSILLRHQVLGTEGPTPSGGLVTACASLLVVFVLRGRWDAAVLGFRPVLDAVLGVDTYLRTLPAGQTPRARISARYTSLLRYLCHWKHDATSDQYSAIVIVAHSQGTVITADLLRFLKQVPDRSLARIASGKLPLYLFTMGCPLRQLYWQRFPDLYQWVESSRSSGAATREIPHDAVPVPRELLLAEWVNACRSGDYVGRFLWVSDQDRDRWRPPADQSGASMPTALEVYSDASGSRRELCIGSGAHTHYWDDTAPLIAHELDRLIARSAYLLSTPSTPPSASPTRAPVPSMILPSSLPT